MRYEEWGKMMVRASRATSSTSGGQGLGGVNPRGCGTKRARQSWGSVVCDFVPWNADDLKDGPGNPTTGPGSE